MADSKRQTADMRQSVREFENELADMSASLAAGPFAAGNTVGGKAKWRSFANSDEAFAFLDKDGDGVLTYEGDHIQSLKNATFGVPRGIFGLYFAAEKQHSIGFQNFSTLAAMARFQTLAHLHVKVKHEARKFELVLGLEGERQRLVEELYTYGAPATAPMYLYDATRPGGCFQGIRSFSRGERYTRGFGAYFTISDPVSWITAPLNYDHPKMEALEVNENEFLDNKIHMCDASYESVVADPQQDGFWWFKGHTIYQELLRAHADLLNVSGSPSVRALLATPQILRSKPQKVQRAYEMSHFAFVNYWQETQFLDVAVKDLGWTLVARSCSSRDGFWAPRCTDHVALFQSNTTLECAFAFEGSDDKLDWVANLDAAVEDFCGFGPVHRGFKHKLMTMIQGLDYRQSVVPKLSSCAGVAVVGHSLGGAQAELFAACANKGLKVGDPGYEDFRYVTWAKGTPAQLPAFYADQVQGAVFLRNVGNDLCIDVRGTMETKYEEDVIAYPCELPGSDYSKDQRWTFTPDGLVVSRLTGFCVTAAPPDSGKGRSVLRQWPCGVGNFSKDQIFEMTEDGWLKSKRTGLCVDWVLRMRPCPASDQRWRFTSDGHLKNVLSGLCLNVRGNPGTQDGADLEIWSCERTAFTDQRWTLTPQGVIKHNLSGKCVSFRNQQGRENRPFLVLGSCAADQATPDVQWDHIPGGFLRNRRTGKCMDVAGWPGTKSGTQVDLYPCEDKHLDASGRFVHMDGGFLRNVANNGGAQHRCLEIFGAKAAHKLEAGAKLHMTGCELNTDQKWELTPQGYIRNAIGARKCLGVQPHSVSEELWLQTCHDPADPNLHRDWKWQLTPEGLVMNVRSLECIGVDVTPSQGAGAHLYVYACSRSKAVHGQTWQLSAGGFLEHSLTGLCLDVFGSPGVTVGAPLVLWTCEAALVTTDQRWRFSQDGFLENTLSGLCIHQWGNRPSLQECPTAPSNQQWSLLPNGLIKNRKTGKCIDVERNETVGTAPSWALLSWLCDASRPQQRWERMASPA